MDNSIPILSKYLSLDISKMKAPRFRDTILIHYIFTGKLKTDAYFVYNYDNKFLNYRTTLYDNYSERVENKLRATVEIFDENNSLDLSQLKEIILKVSRNRYN